MSETMANGRVINVEQASVRTATVTIRALTVNGRQVTLSLFRQLQEETILDDRTGELRGVPWGRVNYCPDKRDDACQRTWQPHLHVVWQLGDELRRATEQEPRHYDHLGESDAWFARQMERWQELQALPQLFIAT